MKARFVAGLVQGSIIVFGMPSLASAQALAATGWRTIGPALQVWTETAGPSPLRRGDTISVRHTVFNDGDSTYDSAQLDPCAFAVRPDAAVREVAPVPACTRSGPFAPGDSITLEWTGVVIGTSGVTRLELSGTLNGPGSGNRKVVSLPIDTGTSDRFFHVRRRETPKPVLYQLIVRGRWQIPDSITIHDVLHDAIESAIPGAAPRAVSEQFVARVAPLTFIRVVLDTDAQGEPTMRLGCVHRRKDGAAVREESGSGSEIDEGRHGMALVTLALAMSRYAASPCPM
jgi:hypothetical protein